MNRIAPLLLLAVAPLAISATDISGEVKATWNDATRMHIGTDAVLRPGHVVTITLSGQVDINQEEKSERKCSFLGLHCKRVNWTEHHWKSPGEVPVQVELRDVATGNVLAQATVGDSATKIEVPFDNVNFGRNVELVGKLSGSGIDPGRSAGAYRVSISIDASKRKDKFGPWLNSAHPSADAVLSSDILDAPFLADHARAAAAGLRRYAQTSLTPRVDADAHERLLRRAVAIAPDDPDNLVALAQYLVSIGASAQADAALKDAIARLAGKTDPVSERQLGDAYLAKASVSLMLSGGVDIAASQSAIAYLEQAISAYRASNRRDLQARALTMRGRLLRGIRTPAALKAAADSFRAALDLTPETAKAQALAPTADGSIYSVLAWDQTATLGRLDGTGTNLLIEDAIPVFWDNRIQRLLILRGGRPQWLDIDSGDTDLAADFDLKQTTGLVGIANGGMLMNRQGELWYASRGGQASRLQFGTSPTCPPPPSTPGWLAMTASSLSADGGMAVTFCSNTLRFFDVSSGTPAQIGQTTLPSAGPGFMPPPNIVAGPQSCGVFVERSTGVFPPSNATLQLIKPSGQILTLDLPAPPPPAGTFGGFLFSTGSIASTFSPDGYLLLSRGDGPYFAFACADGTRTFSIDHPAAANAEMPGRFFVPGNGMRWFDANHFIDLEEGRAIVVDWRGRKARAFPLSGSTGEADRLGQLLMTTGPSMGSEVPRYFRPTLAARSRALGDAVPSVFRASGADNVAIPVPGLGNFILLSGGRYLLVAGEPRREGGISYQLVDLRRADAPLPTQAYFNAVALRSADGWASTDDAASPTRIEYHNGAGAPRAFPLPARSDALVASTAAAIAKTETQFWSAMTPQQRAQPAPPGMLSIEASLALKTDASSIVGKNMALVTLPSLTGLAGAPESAFCTVPVVRSPSSEILAIPAPVDSQLLSVSFREPDPVFEQGILGNCMSAQMLPGRSPILIRNIDAKIEWLQSGSWQTLFSVSSSGSLPTIAAAWTVGPSQGLILTITPGGDYALQRLTSAGAAPACTPCGKLALAPALEAVTKAAETLSESRLRLIGPRAMVLVDPDGTRIAYPDGDDLIVRALDTDKELLRISLAAPIALTGTDLVIDAGNGQMQFHRLQ